MEHGEGARHKADEARQVVVRAEVVRVFSHRPDVVEPAF